MSFWCVLSLFVLLLLQTTVVAKPLEEDKNAEIKGKDPAFVTARHLESRGIGHKRGYTTLDGLFFPYQKGNIWPLLDTRLHRFTNNEYAANQGIGVRYFSETHESVFGANTYYDYRSDCHRKEHFHQVGVGLEFLNELFNVHLNGYFPIHRKRRIQHCVFDDYIGDFVMTQSKYKTALTGANLEVGVPLCLNKDNFFYLAFGPYYYHRECKDTFGGKLRLEMKLYGFLTLEGTVSYDRLFKARAQGQIALTFPKRECRKGIMTRPVSRHEIVVLDEFCKWCSNF